MYYTINSLIIEEFVSIIFLGDSMFNKLIGEVKGIFNIITIIDMIIALIYLMLGIMFFANPTLSNILVSVITGLVLIFNGVSSIFSYIKREGIELFNFNLIFGIVLILLGLLSMVLSNILSIMLGIYIIVTGIQKVTYGIVLKKFNESSWLITSVTGILYIIIAVLAFFTSTNTIVEVTGICLLAFGLINLINIMLLRKRSNYFLG